MLAVAVLICSFLLGKDAERQGFPREKIYDLIFWVVLSGIVGCRIFFVFLNLSYFQENPWEIWMIHRGGLAWQGGLILGGITAFIYMRAKNLPILKTFDLLAPYIALGHAIGRLGCFLNGCCYGREVSWGIYFPVHDAHLHPTQLYEAASLLLIFFLLKNYQKKTVSIGHVFIAYLLLSSLQRFFVEFFRADHTSVWGTLSIFQLVSLGIFFIALYAKTRLKS